MPKHITTQGEYWDTISLLYYGTEHYISNLIEANYKYREIVIFPANITLNIPDVIRKENKDYLPIWR